MKYRWNTPIVFYIQFTSTQLSPNLGRFQVPKFGCNGVVHPKPNAANESLQTRRSFTLEAQIRIDMIQPVLFHSSLTSISISWVFTWYALWFFPLDRVLVTCFLP